MSKIKRLIITAIASLGFVAPMLSPVMVRAQADIDSNLNCGANLKFTAEGAACETDTVDASTRVDGIISTVINIISVVVGIVAVIMIIIGGLKYITSGGESGNVTGAKNTILYAVVGLVVVALAQISVRFVVKETATP